MKRLLLVLSLLCLSACGDIVPIRSVLTGSMLAEAGRGDLVIGDEVQVSTLTFAQSADGRIQISGRRSANGFDYALELTQTEPRGNIFSGREDVRGTNGCTAQYTATMERLPR